MPGTSGGKPTAGATATARNPQTPQIIPFCLVIGILLRNDTPASIAANPAPANSDAAVVNRVRCSPSAGSHTGPPSLEHIVMPSIFSTQGLVVSAVAATCGSDACS